MRATAEQRTLADRSSAELHLRRIVCAGGLSPLATAALRHAVMVARLTTAEVVVLAVNEDEEGCARLERQVRRLGGSRGSLRLAAVGGDPAAAIVGVARRLGADLLVLGAGEHAAAPASTLGAVTRSVLKDAPCPLLTVPAGEEAAPWRRIVCPVNFSPAAEKAAAYAARLARLSGASLTFLHVLEWFEESESGVQGAPFHVPELQLDLEGAARRRLRAILPDLDADVVVTGGDAAQQVLRVAREEGSDLLVLGAHARRAGDLVLSSSTAQRVVRGANCPVLTVRLT